MSEELLRIDRLPTISEFRFILLDVLGRDEPIEWYDLSSICKRRSLNLALSFDGAIKLLSIISFVEISADNSVRRRLEIIDVNELRADYALCVLITKNVIRVMEEKGLLSVIFNSQVVKFDVIKDSFVININLIPFSYPMMKYYLLNMGIAYPDKNTHGKILINSIYKHFFVNEVLSKVLDEATLDIYASKKAGNDSGHKNVDEIDQELENGVKIFVSYSHKDESLKEELEKHFSGLRRNGLIKAWNDRMILPGEGWDSVIKGKMEEADIVIFLISSDFMASDYINDVEIKRAIERHNLSLIKIIPIIARPCDFASLPLSKYQALPKNAKAITLWDNRDEAFLDVVTQFKRIIKK